MNFAAVVLSFGQRLLSVQFFFFGVVGSEGSVILVYDYDSRRFVANGAAEGESAARFGIEESL